MMVWILNFLKKFNPNSMAKSAEKKRGPKDRSYVNKDEQHEVKYEPKRKTAAKEFGKSKQ
jgi:hypothetical protein